MASDRRAVVARLLRDEDALVTSFLTTIGSQIPAYATLDDRQLQEVRSIAAWTLRRVLDLWTEQGRLTAQDITLFRGVGAVRARDGRPLPAVLRAYRVAAVEFLDQVAERFRDEVSAEDVTSLVRVWFAVLDELSEAIYDGYESTGRRLDADRDSSLRALFTDLLLGRQSHAGSLAARLRELDAHLPSTFEIAVAAPTPQADTSRAALLLTGSVVPAQEVSTEVSALDATLDGLGVALLREADGRRLAASAREHGLRIVRHRGVTPRTAPRAYRLAAHALRRAPAAAWSQRTVLDDGDLEVLALVTGHADADPSRVRAAVFGPSADEPAALATLEAVLEADGAAPAAARLHLHPQTVRYRLRRLAAATGRDPRTTWNRYVFQTALLTPPS